MDFNFVLAAYELIESGAFVLRGQSTLPISAKSPLLKKEDDGINIHLMETVAYDLRYRAILHG